MMKVEFSWNYCSMRGSRSKAHQYGGEHTLFYKKNILSILKSLGSFAVSLDPPMCSSLCFVV